MWPLPGFSFFSFIDFDSIAIAVFLSLSLSMKVYKFVCVFVSMCQNFADFGWPIEARATISHFSCLNPLRSVAVELQTASLPVSSFCFSANQKVIRKSIENVDPKETRGQL